MSADLLFTISSNVALLGWLLLIILPNWKGTQKVIFTGLLPFLFGILYIYLILMYFRPGQGGFGSLDQVSQLFQSREALLAGWIHYLAFDLLIGSWELKDSRKHGISHWAMIPSLLLTFMFGPAGLVLYFFVRASKTKKVVWENF